MKKFRKQKLIALALFCLIASYSNACTIVSGVSCNKHVWNANNEDGPFGISNFVNVYPKQKNTRYGYYTLCYLSPMFGNGGEIQGGANEAGLTYDLAAIEPLNKSELQNKKSFPNGDSAILPHILANMGSTLEVVEFFRTYWFENGFTTAQMHVADKNGIFAIISPSGIKITEDGQPLITTNFDICGKEENSACWRFPVANKLLEEQGANLSTMMSLCNKTAQKTGGTMYSNIQNLTTGQIWFFSKHDPNIIVTTTIMDLLANGQKSYTMNNLKSIVTGEISKNLIEPQSIDITNEHIEKIIGTYSNWYLGEIVITPMANGIRMASQFGEPEELIAQSNSTFFIPGANVYVEFVFDEKDEKRTMSLYENGSWSFSAWNENNNE